MIVEVETLQELAELTAEYVKLGILFKAGKIPNGWRVTLTGGY